MKWLSTVNLNYLRSLLITENGLPYDVKCKKKLFFNLCGRPVILNTLSRKLSLYVVSMINILLTVTFLVLERNLTQSWGDLLFSQRLSFALVTPEQLNHLRGSSPPDESPEIVGMH